MKECPTCQLTKELSEFYRNRSRPDGRAAQCKACEREHRAENPEPFRGARAAWEQRNPESVRAKGRRSHERHRDRRNQQKREARQADPLGYIERRYGITPAQYEALYAAQNGQCAICDEPHARLHIDHHHGTGDVRGLLCKKCNLALGLLRDSPEIASRAADYLRSVSAMSISLERSA